MHDATEEFLQRAQDKMKTRAYRYEYKEQTDEYLRSKDEDGNEVKIFERIGSLLQEANLFKELAALQDFLGKIKGVSPTDPEAGIPGMNVTTQDRPIDSTRNITFQGVGGTLVRLDFPNLYEIPVFKKTENTLTLMSLAEIQQSIQTYLRNRIKEYNTQLQTQLAVKKSRYDSYKDAFLALGKKDQLAIPHTYTLLDENYFIELLTSTDPEAIRTIANVLYMQNQPRQERLSSSTAGQDILFTQEATDLNHKITHVVQQYLEQDTLDQENIDRATSLSLPAYNQS